MALIRMRLCYSALSPFCRKVRMALDHKRLRYEVVQVDRLADLPLPSPRAEVPVLESDGLVVANSPDILAYLDRLEPTRPLYPADPRVYAEVKHWELLADSRLDAIVSVIGMFRLAATKLPDGLAAAAQSELVTIYDGMDVQLANREYFCGAPSAADFAAYPHVASGAALGLRCQPGRHRHLLQWLHRMRERPEGEADANSVRDWWLHRPDRPVDVRRINWGTFRLEWLLANGQTDWFAAQVRADRVLWSVGPNRQCADGHSVSPAAPA